MGSVKLCAHCGRKSWRMRFSGGRFCSDFCEDQHMILTFQSKMNTATQMQMSPSACVFCGMKPVATQPGANIYQSLNFCSQWCENYWNMNGQMPATVCSRCGWRGADQDFYYDSSTAATPMPLCQSCCPVTALAVSDEEFEEYRQKIMEALDV